MRAAFRAAPLAALLAAAPAARASAPERPPGFGDDARALEAWLALEQDQPIRSRELAEALLASEPDSFAAHCLIAQVLRRGEADPARALLSASRCRSAFEARHGAEPGSAAPWFWHRLALYELYAASEELDRPGDSLRWLDALERYHPGLIDAFRGWPLLRLGRIEDARKAAERALARRANRVQVAKAWTVLCALEGRVGDLEAAHAACRQALAHGPNPADRAVRLINTAEAARALGRVDEAESLLREATGHFAPGTPAAPWLELVELYVGQGRLSEARGALGEMARWQRRQPARVRAHSGARHQRAAALFLLASGRAVEAARISRRMLDAPDRTGETSASRAQLELGAAILARASCRAAAQQRLEEASWSSAGDRLRAWLDAAGFAWCAWASERRAAALLASEPALHASGRSLVAGIAGLPAWLEPDVVAIAGAGTARALLEPVPASGYAKLYAAEIAAGSHDADGALRAARAALEALPPFETLLRARAALRAGDAASRLGDAQAAAAHHARALQLDPGAPRRWGSALPVALDADAGPLSRAAARLLGASPRLRLAARGLRLALRQRATGASACLLDAHGAQLACAAVEQRADESPASAARRLAAAFHARALAPRIEWTGGDPDSLEAATAEPF